MTDQQPEDPAAGAPEDGTARTDRTRVEGAPRPSDPTRIEGTPADGASEDAATDRTLRQADPGRDELRHGDPGQDELRHGGSGQGGSGQGDPEQGEPGQGGQQSVARWSGSAAVPAHVPKRPWWSRRRTEAAGDGPAPAVDPWADSEDWSATPAVDPWADQDTPWQPEIPFPEAMPPTRMESAVPPTRMEAPLPPTRTEPPVPPTRMEAPVPPTRMEAPSGVGGAAGLPLAAGPPVAPTPGPGSSPRKRGWGRRKKAKQPAPVQANRLPVQPRPPAPQPPPPPAPPRWTAPSRTARPAPARPTTAPWAPSNRSVQAPPAQGPPAQGRPAQGRPAQGPPGPRPPRRKRRWTRNLFLFTLLSAVCCCGVPAYFAWPAAHQYPVSATLPQSVADLDLREDAAGRRAVEKLSEQLSGTNLAQGDVFAGVYADGNGKRVTVFGTTGLRLTPESDVETEITHLADAYSIKDIQSYDLGETGVHERCGVGRSGGKAVVVCAWADHGSLATVLMTRRSVEESADLTGVLRSVVLTRG